jgi:hypothetical protein
MTRGSCLCGGVRFEVTGPFGLFGHDHCSRSRKATGSAFATVIFCKPSDFRWLAGESQVKIYEAPVRDEPPGYRRIFCGVCGSPVPLVDRDRVSIPAGALDDDPVARPMGHVFTACKAPWFEITDALPQFARRAE